MDVRRISYVEVDRAEANIRFRTAQNSKLLALIENEPRRLRQRRLAGLVDNYAAIGLFKYAIGYDLGDVRLSLLKAIGNCVELFRWRGTLEAFPALSFRLDPSKVHGDPNRANLEPMHSSGEKDFSMTNSKTGARYTLMGLAINEAQLASELGRMIWDPPNADYIGYNSEVCTPNDQAFGYALREFLLGNIPQAVTELARIRAIPDTIMAWTAHLFAALISRDALVFRSVLTSLLQRHEKDSRFNPLRSAEYICLPAMGLAACATKVGLIRHDELPFGNVYLPISLFSPE